MSSQTAHAANAPEAGNRYRHDFSRHLLGVARHLQTSMMDTLLKECGHTDLRLGFAPYITLIGDGDKRLTDLAEILGITRQACNQAVKQVEAAGYIERRADPADGRAKRIALSPAGMQLREDGLRVVARMDRHFAAVVGEQRIADAGRSIGRIYQHLSLGLAAEDNSSASHGTVGGFLPRLSDYTLQRLMELTRAKGHPDLKLSFEQVLTHIGPSGGRIQQMAAVHDVSKQAISAIATELAELGYLQRDADPLDARQVVLTLTPHGEQLMADSVASGSELEAEFADIVGKAAFRRVAGVLRDLFEGLAPEANASDTTRAADLSLLARQLRQQLGEQGSRALARLLLSPEHTAR
jgi:DNA-binding MarR family transcriptional regulator